MTLGKKPSLACKAIWKRIYDKLVEKGRHGVATGGNKEEEPLDSILEKLKILYESRTSREPSARRSAKRRTQQERQEIRNQRQSVADASRETYNRARLQGLTGSDGSRNAVAIPPPTASPPVPPTASPQSSADSSPIRRHASSSSSSQAAMDIDEALVDVLRKVAGALECNHRGSQQEMRDAEDKRIKDMEERIVERMEREMSRQISSLKEVVLSLRRGGDLGGNEG
ncbi:hypothetical protein IE53DRAFT_368204 [Violaceomyces palustris]|uniref:Uncharacterized protein n=1 Tax=Violaceomyces palustris TaxID=1673888 RepID=A0ACD0NZK4_9BASI|nr:hypothetical protein IE53DRAFT_368204 [Violaceomyces palustris]